MSDYARIGQVALDAIPGRNPDPIQWAEEFFINPTSARSKKFNISITPWLVEPIYYATDLYTRTITLMKPIQSGGSAFGELLFLYWSYFWHGFLQYNWSDDVRAEDRWESRILPIVKNCDPLWKRAQFGRIAKGEIDFGNTLFRCQGVFSDRHLDSDSVHMQINEEIHSWKPGYLDKARGRSTAVWNYKSVDISNAGRKDDQLHQAMKQGTHQRWVVKCPGCSNPHHEANAVYHPMRSKWEDSRPDLGGLRYSANESRRGFMEYDYNTLRPTIRYQMPCGFVVRNDDLEQRRKLNAKGSGKYNNPENTGAELIHRSFTYDSVIVDYIDWMTLIRQKHIALKARHNGDPEPWRRYTCERECLPYDPDNIPVTKMIVLSEKKKNREGLPAPKLRTFALDYQGGEKDKGELPYWWLVIRDFKVFFGSLKSSIVYEGRIETDEEAIRVIDDHNCERHQGVADSGHDAEHVYAFCIRYGINAIKGGKEQWYAHEGGARRSYSPERPLHAMMNRPPKYPYVEKSVSNGVPEEGPDDREPLFWLYSKGAIRERYHYLRHTIDWEVSADVSEDYKEHNDAEERTTRIAKSNGETIVEWTQRKRRNDLFVCECYCCMLLDMSGMAGECEAVEVTTTNATK